MTTTTTTKTAAQTNADLMAEIARLKAALSATERALKLKVSAKGGLSVYGLGRFPITLYVEQWERLLAMTDKIRAFIEEHRSELKLKGDATSTTATDDLPF